MAVAITINSIIEVFNAIPSTFNDTLNYNSTNNEAQQIADGWRDVIQPTYNTETQRKGAIFFDTPNDVYTYEVIDLTDEQIQANIVAQSESEKQQLIQQIVETDIVANAQTGDDTSSLDAQALFPMWSGDAVAYEIDYKVQSFLVDNTLVLYRVVQAHTSQANWIPRDVPALFSRVAYPDEILPWVQPIGASDAYRLGDKVTHLGQTWENTGSDANVWEPGVFGWVVI